MLKLNPVQKTISGLFLAGIAVVSLFEACSGTTRETVSVIPPVKQDPDQECIVWSHNDSATMEVVHMANAYIFDHQYDKARVLFRHAAKMPHDLPGIAMNAGLLTQLTPDTIEAQQYFRMEVQQDLRILQSRLPDCRKYEFLVTLYRCYRLLDEPHKADSILKKYKQVGNRATPSGEVMRGAWAVY